jgi:hypothetical protein
VSADGPMELVWHKSSTCFPSECVEVAACGGMILIRDSADTAGTILGVSHHEWRIFVNRVVASYRSPHHPEW